MATPLRFGLIGYGAWGKHHAAAIRATPGAMLAGICCKSEATALQARHTFPDVPVVHDYRALLARSDIDAVDIVVPTHLHAEMGVAALEAGKNVLLEKPMAATVAECDRLIRAAQQAKRVLTVGHELRLSPQWGRAKALVDAGELGDPLYALISLFRFPYRPGAERWRYAGEKVGSWILEEPVHFFDLLRWYFERRGAPRSVHAFGDARGERPGMCANFTAVLRFEGDAHGVITETLGGFENHFVLQLVGTEGSLRSWWSGRLDRSRDPAFGFTLQRRGRSTPEALSLGPSGEAFELEEELRRTVAAFQQHRPLVPPTEARMAVLLCQAAERSLVEGREIVLSPAPEVL
jgi:myo-inositol 2-dehydrogenase/D-chiro-inositol 1-dehydrogenase